MSRTATVTVDLDDFSDEDILGAAYEIAASIGSGQKAEALILLERMVADQPRLVAAIETGRRRAKPAPEPVFECMVFDAHLPSMTVRFRVPQGFPLAGGIFGIQRLRTSSPEDEARWARFEEPPQLAELHVEALRDMVAAFKDEATTRSQYAAIDKAEEAILA